MTPEQVELEYAHMQEDKRQKDAGAYNFADEEFDDYEREIEEEDGATSDAADGDFDRYAEASEGASGAYSDDDWEEVEDGIQPSS